MWLPWMWYPMSALEKSWGVLKLQGASVGQGTTNIYGNSTGGATDPNTSGTPGASDAASDAEKQRKKEEKAQAWLDDEALMQVLGDLKPYAEDWERRVQMAQGMLPIEDVREDKHKQHAKLLESAADGAKKVIGFLDNAAPSAMGVSHSMGADFGRNQDDLDDEEGIGE